MARQASKSERKPAAGVVKKPAVGALKRPASNDNGFAEEDNAIAFLLAGYSSERNTWSDHVTAEITGVRAMSLFFCPVMMKLRKRGKTIEKACKKNPELAKLKVQRRPLNTLARGEPVTLDGVLHVYRVLNAVTESSDEAVRETTTVSRRGDTVNLVMEENDVVPSHIWVNGALMVEIREKLDISRTRLSELIFGEKYDGVFKQIEEGETDGKTEYDFRVTPFTQQAIQLGLKLLEELFAEPLAKAGHTLPSSGDLFKTSSTAGLGAKNRTRALPMEAGNLTRPLSAEYKKDIESRIRAYARKQLKKV